MAETQADQEDKVDWRERALAAEDRIRELLAIKSADISIRETRAFGELRSLAAPILAECYYDLLDGYDAPNFLELRFGHERGDLLVRIQKVEGKTPAQVQKETKGQLRRAVEALRSSCTGDTPDCEGSSPCPACAALRDLQEVP